MELCISVAACGLVLAVLWLGCRQVCQADTAAAIGAAYLRAAGGARRPGLIQTGQEMEAGSQAGWDC